MTAAKSIQAMDGRLAELRQDMADAFAREHPSHPLVAEAAVLTEALRKLSAIGEVRVAPMNRIVRLAEVRRGKQPKGRVAQHMAATLAVRAAGHPLQTGEIVAAMPAHGADISGPNAERNLTSIISKRGDLKSVRWRGKRAWWPKGERMPE